MATGGALPIAPALPDFQALLQSVTDLLSGVLGTSSPRETPPAPEEPEVPAASESTEPEAGQDARETSDPSSEGETEEEEREREALRRGHERDLEEASPPGAQLARIREIVERLQEHPSLGTDPATVRAIERLRQLLQGSQPESGAPVAPAESLPEASAPGAAAIVETTSAELSMDLPQSTPSAPPPVEGAEGEAPALPETAAVVELELAPAELPATVSPDPARVPAALAAVVARLPEPVLSTEPAVRAEVLGAATESRPSGVRPPALPALPASAGDRAEFVDRIVKAVKLTQSRGAARIKIVLNPPNLGELRVDLSVRQHVLHGTLQAESVAAKDLILSNLQSLREGLEGQGIRVGEFSVQVDPSFQQAQQDARQAPAHPPATAAAQDSEDEPSGPVQERLRSARIQVFDVVA